MDYDINFRYLDGKDFITNLSDKNMAEFIRCLSSGEVFFNEVSRVGLWIPIEKIRYFTMREREDGREVTGGISQISDGNVKAKKKKRITRQ